MTTPLAAKIAREYGTPCAVIDMDRVERNIARIQVACDTAGVANRPHIKTHKSPLLAQMQVAAGAKGITCQKIGEAEVMAEAGIDDILISYNLIGEEKMARLAALQAKANMTVAADNSTVIAGLPQAAAASGRPLSVVVECDTGRKRAGVETPAEAIALARRDRGVQGTEVRGLHAVSDRNRLGRGAKILRRSAGRRPRARARCDDGFDRRLAEPEEPRQAQGRDRASAGHLHLQRPHAGRRRRRRVGRLRAQHLFHRRQPRRPGPRHSRCRLEDADVGHRRRARGSRADPGASRKPRSRALPRSTAFSISPAAIRGLLSATSCGSCPTMSASSST